MGRQKTHSGSGDDTGNISDLISRYHDGGQSLSPKREQVDITHRDGTLVFEIRFITRLKSGYDVVALPDTRNYTFH